MKKITCIKISRPSICEKTSYIMKLNSGAAETELENLIEIAEIGDSLMFEIIEIEEQELDDLPEFEGW